MVFKKADLRGEKSFDEIRSVFQIIAAVHGRSAKK